MTERLAGLGALIRLEMRRGVHPLGRALLAPATLIILALVRSAPDHGLVLAAMGVALALAAAIVAVQVGRDRNDGTLAYLASLPIRGEVLVGARVLATAGFTIILVLGLLPAAHLLLPATPWSELLGGAAVAWATSTGVGCVLVGLLSRFTLQSVINYPLVAAIVAGFVLDRSSLGTQLSIWLQRSLLGGTGFTVLLGSGLLSAGVAVAFLLGRGGLQPAGGAPTERARRWLGSPSSPELSGPGQEHSREP